MTKIETNTNKYKNNKKRLRKTNNISQINEKQKLMHKTQQKQHCKHTYTHKEHNHKENKQDIKRHNEPSRNKQDKSNTKENNEKRIILIKNRKHDEHKSKNNHTERKKGKTERK